MQQQPSNVYLATAFPFRFVLQNFDLSSKKSTFHLYRISRKFVWNPEDFVILRSGSKIENPLSLDEIYRLIADDELKVVRDDTHYRYDTVSYTYDMMISDAILSGVDLINLRDNYYDNLKYAAKQHGISIRIAASRHKSYPTVRATLNGTWIAEIYNSPYNEKVIKINPLVGHLNSPLGTSLSYDIVNHKLNLFADALTNLGYSVAI